MMADTAVAGGRVGFVPAWAARIVAALYRSPRRRGRAPLAVAAGVFRRRDRGLFRAEGRAAVVARCRRGDRRRRSELRPAPTSGMVRGGARAHRLRRRLCADRRDRLGAPGADAAAPARPGRRHRAGHRHRLGAEAAGASSSRPIPCPASTRPVSRAACAFISRRRATSSTPATGSASRRCSTRCRRRYCRAGAICSASCTSPGSAGSATALAAPAGSPARKGLRSRRRLARGSAALRTEMTRRITAVLPGLDRRGRLGADHRQARRDRRGGQAGLSRFRSVASAGDRRAASGAGRRLCVLRRARRSGADPAGGAALSDQEDRRRRHARRADLLSADLGRGDPDRARLRHERHRLCRDPDRPAAHLDADLRDRRRGRAGARSGEPGRRQLSDVVRRGRRADRGVRDLWRKARPAIARPLAVGRSRWAIAGRSRSRPSSRRSAPSRSRSTTSITSRSIRRSPMSSRCR